MGDHDFSFPYPPYDIQLDLMRTITQCISEKKIGILESPTGTGKTLSVVCSVMSWLEQFEREELESLRSAIQEKKVLLDEKGKENEDWLEESKRKFKTRKELSEIEENLARLENIRLAVEKADKGEKTGRNRKRRAGDSEDNELEKDQTLETEQDEFAPPLSYDSDGEKEESLQDEENLKVTKIFYASRTHSQLEQIMDELTKTRFKPRIVTAASRQVLCVNEEVRKLKLSSLMNERCMELRKNGSGGIKKTKGENGVSKKTGKSSTCCFYTADNIEELSNGIVARKLRHPEQISSEGKAVNGCAYFATRRAIPLCQMVLVPYQVLLHSGTRAAWGIDLKDNVVVLDEAHNVLQTINSVYSCDLNHASLVSGLKLINEYIETYRLRLKAKNLLYIRQLLVVVKALEVQLRLPNASDEVLEIQTLIIKLSLVDVNIQKLVQYMERTDLCKKFHGFYSSAERREITVKKAPTPSAKLSGVSKLLAKKVTPIEADSNIGTESVPTQSELKPSVSPLFTLKTFLEAMNNRVADGRVIIDRKLQKYRYILLNPAEVLADVLGQTRSALFLGGTMEPSHLLVDSIAQFRNREDIIRFSCGHVIKNNQLLALAIGETVGGKPFCLTYETRNNKQVLLSLAETLLQLVSVIPNGCVVFMPSYDFLANVIVSMKDAKIYDKLNARKVVLVEQRGSSTDVWDKFSRCAKSTKGALLFAVVGGKLSEGINFSDELGRAVIMVGLPYPNKEGVELKERMKHLDAKWPGGGKRLYDSLCMHAVNQAIGRAIRHRNDYAAVLLLDNRFGSVNVVSQLSGWIRSRLQKAPSATAAISRVRSFFTEKS